MSRASAKSTVGFIPHLSNPGNGEKHHGEPQQPDCPVSVDIMAWKQVVLNRMLTKQDSDERGGCIGVPVYFFFNLASANLADNAQLINLDAIAELAKEWQLTVRETGAADSATGSADGNASLSQSRADHISRMLQEKGVPGEKIQTVAEGGIEKFSPPDVNRQCKVELIF